MITSSQNPKIKLIRSLQDRPKERRQAGAFLAEGVRLVEEALDSDWPFDYILYADELSERARLLIQRLEARGVNTEQVSGALLQSLGETETSQGLLAVLRESRLPLPRDLQLILIPDRVRDPGNLGTLLRSASAAGVDAVFLPPETADAFAPKIVRAGMGAHFRLPIQSVSWEEIGQICTSGKLTVFLADMAGRSCWETDLRTPMALIIGGEANGASPQAEGLTSQKLSIPMPGGAESLNAAVAGSVLLFEVIRQRSLETKH